MTKWNIGGTVKKETLTVTTVTSVYKGESFDHLLIYDKEFLLTSKTIDKLFGDGTYYVRINLNCCAQVYTLMRKQNGFVSICMVFIYNLNPLCPKIEKKNLLRACKIFKKNLKIV